MPSQQPVHNDLSLINRSVELDAVATSAEDNRLAESEQEWLLNDGRRGEAFRKHIHNIVVACIYVIGIIMIGLVLIRFYHFIAPPGGRWLNDHDLHNIERIIFSGIIASLAAKYFKKYRVLDE